MSWAELSLFHLRNPGSSLSVTPTQCLLLPLGFHLSGIPGAVSKGGPVILILEL